MNTWDTRIRLWYLSGGMTKFGINDFDESNNWRKYLKDKVKDLSEGHVICFNPNEHWSMKDDPSEFTDREAMNLDIYKLRRSELVIFNNNDPFSRGSMIELGIAWERGIPILVLNNDNKELHPWVFEFAEKVFTDINNLLTYLEIHYLCID